jgi:hypothetical protein
VPPAGVVTHGADHVAHHRPRRNGDQVVLPPADVMEHGSPRAPDPGEPDEIIEAEVEF